MILSRTYKVYSNGVELRVYVRWFNADEVNEITLAVQKDIEAALGFSENDECALKRSLNICSNRAGLHFAYVYSGNTKIIRAKLEDFGGWKECKGA